MTNILMHLHFEIQPHLATQISYRSSRSSQTESLQKWQIFPFFRTVPLLVKFLSHVTPLDKYTYHTSVSQQVGLDPLLGHQLVFYSGLWVCIYRMLRTTVLHHHLN